MSLTQARRGVSSSARRRSTPANPKLQTFTDAFTTLDTSKWAFGPNASLNAGRLQLVATTAYDGWATSLGKYDLVASYGRIEVPQIASGPGTRVDTEFSLRLDASNSLVIVKEGALLYFQRTVAGTTTTIATATYSATTHRRWGFSESAGTVSFDTSDGTTWTSRATWVSTFSLAGLEVGCTSGFYSPDTSAPTPALYDNLNL